MVRDRGKAPHVGLGKHKRNEEGTSLGVDAIPDRSGFPTLLPKHKIFLSHSGKQKWFVEKLCEDLEARHRFPFFDKRPSSLPEGERFPELIFEAAKQCELAVVVVSEEYLTSKWPMIELNTFVKALAESNPGLKILPLFFEMSVRDFKSSSRQGEWLKVWNEWARDDERMNPVEFKEALKVMCSYNGIKFNGDMDNLWSFEKKVVRSICRKVAADVRREDSDVQGRSTLCEVTREKIKVIRPSKKYGICVFGYYGVGGIGKTTMCKTLCNELSEFSGKVCHIELGGTKSEEQMLKQVLKELTGTSEELLQQSLDKDQCRNILKNRSSWRQKTFLAIDNVWDDHKSMEQAQMFLDEPGFHEGSVVVVTSRCRSTLMGLGICESHCFEVPELEKVDAMKVFLHHVAGGKQFDSGEDIWVMEHCLARCRFRKSETQGYHYLPLALKVLGMHLRRLGDSPAKWWEDLPTVRDFNRFPGDNPVFDIIRLNYDRLSEQLQALFMDVAVFKPSNDKRKIASPEYERDYFDWLSGVHGQKLQDTQSQLQRLKESGVLEDVDMDSGRVSMHDLYAEFAEMEAEGKLNSYVDFKSRRWVYFEGSYPSDLERTPSGGCWENLIRVRIRLWDRDSRVVFNSPGIQLRYCLNLVVLKLLIPVEIAGPLNFAGLRCLRSLELERWDLRALVVEGVEDLNNLRSLFCNQSPWVKYHGSSYWGQLPASLEILELDGVDVCLRSDVFDRCKNLHMLSLCRIGASDSIDFSQCSSLRSVTLEGIVGLRKVLGLAAGSKSCLQSLKVYDILPGDLGGLRQLRKLHLRFLDVTELPDLSALEHLHVLNLYECEKLTIVEGVAGLAALRSVILHSCRSLSRLPDLSNSTKLERLELRESGIELHEEDIDMLAALPSLQSVVIDDFLRLDLVRRKMVLLDCIGRREVAAERNLESLPFKVCSYTIRSCLQPLVQYPYTHGFEMDSELSSGVWMPSTAWSPLCLNR